MILFTILADVAAQPTTPSISSGALTLFDAISFIASIASLLVSVGAIWLSVVFFRLSDAASKSTTEAAKGISASIERLEKLFDKLYSDTFSMMRETVTDMRKHIWRDNEVVPSSQSLKDAIRAQLDDVLPKTEKGNNKEQIAERLGEMLEKLATEKAASVEIDTEKVASLVRTLPRPTPERIAKILEVEEEHLAVPLFSMRKQGLITWKGSKNTLSSDTVLEIPAQVADETKPDQMGEQNAGGNGS